MEFASDTLWSVRKGIGSPILARIAFCKRISLNFPEFPHNRIAHFGGKILSRQRCGCGGFCIWEQAVHGAVKKFEFPLTKVAPAPWEPENQISLSSDLRAGSLERTKPGLASVLVNKELLRAPTRVKAKAFRIRIDLRVFNLSQFPCNFLRDGQCRC